MSNLETATTPTLWDSLVSRAKAERDRVAQGSATVTREELDVELTPFGYLRWYLHNDLTEPVTRALYFAELEIPAGSRSGKLTHQGGIVHLIVEGEGYTEFDDRRYDWEATDVIAIPVRPDGVTFQHFNDGAAPVRMVLSWPNFSSALGPESGVAMEISDVAPEFAALRSAAEGSDDA